MKNKAEFIKALTGLLNYWGGDTPPEAIWAFNDLLKWYCLEYGFTLPYLLEEDRSNEDIIFEWLDSGIAM